MVEQVLYISIIVVAVSFQKWAYTVQSLCNITETEFQCEGVATRNIVTVHTVVDFTSFIDVCN